MWIVWAYFWARHRETNGRIATLAGIDIFLLDESASSPARVSSTINAKKAKILTTPARRGGVTMANPDRVVDTNNSDVCSMLVQKLSTIFKKFRGHLMQIDESLLKNIPLVTRLLYFEHDYDPSGFPWRTSASDFTERSQHMR